MSQRDGFYAFRRLTSIGKEDRIVKPEPDFRAGKILFLMNRWYEGGISLEFHDF